MGWTFMLEGGIVVHVHMEKVLGMELPGRRKRGKPRRRYIDVNCEEEDRGCWMTQVVERYDPLWRPLTGSAEGRRKSFRLNIVHTCNACVI